MTQEAVYCNLRKQIFIGDRTSHCRSLTHREKFCFLQSSVSVYFSNEFNFTGSFLALYLYQGNRNYEQQ
jgi:hypothetical protein